MSYSGRNIDRYQPPPADNAKEKSDFIKRLGNSLAPLERDILVLKYVYNEDFSTIAKELKILSTETVIRVHDDTLKRLKGLLK